MNRPTTYLAGLLAAALAVCVFHTTLAQAGEPDTAPIATVQARSEVLLPPDSDTLAWRYGMKLGDWSGGCTCYFYEFNTPELIDRRIKEMQGQGYNALIMNGFHMHSEFLDRWPRISQHTKEVAAAAHRSGMKVVFHHDVPVLEYNGKGLQQVVAHPDWLARDIEHDRPTFRWYCIMNPDFRKSYFDRMEKLVRETGIDGVMLDEAFFPDKEFCGCEHCRRAFTEVTGLILPRGNTSKVFHNKNEPLWIEWLKWRKRAVGDWWVALRKVFNRVKPDLCIMIYTTHNGFTYPNAAVNYGYDLTDLSRGCDFLGTEIMARNVYDVYRPVFACRKAKAGLGDLYGTSIWGLVYHENDPVFAYFGWAMNHMNRQTTWMASIEGENMRRYLNWPHRMKTRFVRPVSDLAIVFSSNSRDFGRLMPTMSDCLGISQCLSDAHLQHDFLMEDAVLDARKLGRYKLVVLGSVSNLSVDQTRAIREYVQAGGRLLVTGHTSLLSESGFVQKNFQLAEVMGVDYTEKSMVSGPHKIAFPDGGATLTAPGQAVGTRIRPGAEQLAAILDGEGRTSHPAIVANRFGKGRCVYVAFQPGAANFEREQVGGKPQQFAKNAELARLLVQLVRDATGSPLDFEPVRVPEKVLVTVCRQEVAGKSEVLVHLLNATGAGVKPGEIIPLQKDWKKAGDPFPPIQEDLVFDLRLDKTARGFFVSPDYEGERPVTLAKRENGSLRVTVRKEDLKAYGIVYLPLTTEGKNHPER